MKFEDLTLYFDDFNVVETLTNSNLPMEWFFDFNGGKDYLAFSFVGHKYPIYLSSDDGVSSPPPDTKLNAKLALSQVVSKVKDECEGAIQGLVSKLESNSHNMR
jgi:hypothetical protein